MVPVFTPSWAKARSAAGFVYITPRPSVSGATRAMATISWSSPVGSPFSSFTTPMTLVPESIPKASIATEFTELECPLECVMWMGRVVDTLSRCFAESLSPGK